MSIERRLMWTVLGAAASKLARKRTRQVMHTASGAPRLPRRMREEGGLGTVLVLALVTGALMAFSDVLSEQRKNAARSHE